MGLSNVVAATSIPTKDIGSYALPSSFREPHWYAIYTCANHEKRVAAEIEARGIEHFLPLYSSVRRWKDRRINLELPLFPGYLFVRLPLQDRLRVLQIPSVVRFVAFGSQPAALPNGEMETLRAGMSQGLCAKPHPFLSVGRRVRICRGAFRDLQGILIRRRGLYRVVISIELIQRSMAVEIDLTDVEAT